MMSIMSMMLQGRVQVVQGLGLGIGMGGLGFKP